MTFAKHSSLLTLAFSVVIAAMVGVSGWFCPSVAFAAEATDSSVATDSAVIKAFPDVAVTSPWYFESVYRASLAGLFAGYENGNFGPEDSLTRAQAAVVLWRYLDSDAANAYDQSTATNTTSLLDVASNDWYTGAANWAVANGIINGIQGEHGSTAFGGGYSITREQLCAILANYAAGDLTNYDDSSLDALPDGRTASSWAQKSVAWALDNGIISGVERDGQRWVDAGEKVTRATMAAIMVNAIDNGVFDGSGAASLPEDTVLVDLSVTMVQVSAANGVTKDALVEYGGAYYFATFDGCFAHGVYQDTSTGYTYLASSSDGSLPDGGWIVSSQYAGSTERYWVDETTHACIPGYSADGWPHYTTTSGYVLRGNLNLGDCLIKADNDGKLITDGMSAGWYVGDSLTGTLDRFYLEDRDGMKVIRTGFFTAKLSGSTSSFFGLEDGSVARGKTETQNGILLSNNDGVLVESSHKAGWMVTDAYDGEYQRYYLQEIDGHLYAPTGFFTANLDGDEAVFYGVPEGYVLRGKLSMSDGVLVADNDGVLMETYYDEGWVVSADYDSEHQRYYLEEADGHLYAKTGYFEANLDVGDGNGYCTHEFMGNSTEGYVYRNTDNLYYDGFIYSADNNGVLTVTGIGGSSSGTRDDRLDTVTWSTDTAYLARMKTYASIYESGTDYFIAADWTLCRVTILQRSGSSWVVVKCWNGNFGWNGVGVGGTHTIKHKQICNWDDSYFGLGYNDWSSCYIESYADYNVGGHSRYIDGYGWEDCASIHSTGYEYTGWDQTGCIGLLWDNAKWVYDVIPIGTNLYLF